VIRVRCAIVCCAVVYFDSSGMTNQYVGVLAAAFKAEALTAVALEKTVFLALCRCKFHHSYLL
jgi:hypothetical protein